MLQDARLIRHYQVITDSLVDFWHRGYRQSDDLRFYLDGYLSALRTLRILEPFEIHRVEEEVLRFLRDPSNFMEATEYSRY